MGARRKLSQSLATKVILSTVMLSLGVISLTGSALYSRLSDGIRQVSLDSALAESRFTFFNAQYQMLLSQGDSVEERKKALADLIISTTTQSSEQSRREVIFVKVPGERKTKVSYEMSSSLIKADSIPKALRERIQKGTDLHYEYADLLSGQVNQGNALFVGERINIPTAGRYEMYIAFILTSQTETLDLVRNSLLFTGVALVFLIGMITWLVVRQVVRPVRDAARIATQFTQGDFSQRMRIESQDEMATLANSYNEMAQSIEQQISRLENLSRVQQRFVSDVSHELRTPLTTLRMASEVIHSSKDSFDPIVARSAELLVAQLDRFERLLEDLLEVSRFDAEVAVLEAVDFDIVQLVQRCADDLALVAKERKTEIYVTTAQPVIMIKADIRRVERILRNLLANAIDHAEELQIDVRIEASEHDVAVGVRDYGVGLDENALIRVFDRFWRADPSRARTRGGTGLGLSIALEDARLHNGELEAWGRPGRGAHFVVTLPRNTWESIDQRLIPLQPEDYKA